MKIAVIGGGLTGLVTSYKLSKLGHQVILYEKDAQLGGLATYTKFGSFYWDKFYHVILPFDSYLIDFIKEIGLSRKLNWKQTYTGYYTNNKYYSISNSKEFIQFPLLNIFSKIRLALTIFKASKITDWKKLEQITVKDWLIKTGGNKNFQNFWEPLLLAKLGPHYKRVSALFIWTYIKRLFEARNSSAKKEHLGYVTGGYKTIIEKIEQELIKQGSEINTNTTVDKIKSDETGLKILCNGNAENYDKIIFTGPTNLLSTVAENDIIDNKQKHSKVEYLGVVCLVLLTKKQITDFYVLNIADQTLPFTGVIGLSTIVDQALTDGKFVTYFPKYVMSSDKILHKSDDEITKLFMVGINKMFPELEQKDIAGIFVHRAVKVQPLQVVNYSNIIPKINSKHSDLYILNTSQLISETLNNNAVIKQVTQFIDNKNIFRNQL